MLSLTASGPMGTIPGELLSTGYWLALRPDTPKKLSSEVTVELRVSSALSISYLTFMQTPITPSGFMILEAAPPCNSWNRIEKSVSWSISRVVLHLRLTSMSMYPDASSSELASRLVLIGSRSSIAWQTVI